MLETRWPDMYPYISVAILAQGTLVASLLQADGAVWERGRWQPGGLGKRDGSQGEMAALVHEMATDLPNG